MEQIIAHLIGDYIFQTHTMATKKVSSWYWALVHGFFYTLPFGFFITSLKAMLVIFLTHSVIDRFRLANYVARLKNNCWTKSGYPDGTPDFLWVWLNIILDNTIHLTINYLAIKYL